MSFTTAARLAVTRYAHRRPTCMFTVQNPTISSASRSIVRGLTSDPMVTRRAKPQLRVCQRLMSTNLSFSIILPLHRLLASHNLARPATGRKRAQNHRIDNLTPNLHLDPSCQTGIIEEPSILPFPPPTPRRRMPMSPNLPVVSDRGTRRRKTRTLRRWYVYY